MDKKKLQEIQKHLPDHVTLIAVSKTHTKEEIDEAYACGCRVFGENKVQELKEKYDLMPKDINWHMIGHLQRNKIKYVVDRACMIHSIDSIRLAQAVEEEAAKREKVIPVLLEINIAREESKFGFLEEEVYDALEIISKLPHLRIEGLMTIAPFVENAEENRVHFKNLRKLSVDIKQKNIDNVNMCNLSMGMTGDYEIAIEEGATFVRVGTGIFGERNYIK